MTAVNVAAIWAGRAEPILPTASIPRIIAFWSALGFTTAIWPDDDGYAWVRPGPAEGISMDYNHVEDYDPFMQSGMAYLTVADVDAVHESIIASGVAFDSIDDDGLFRYSMNELRARWRAGEPLARVTRPTDQVWHKREIALFDPDNNLIRIGSAI
jgi:hypothetical protein